MAALTAAGTEFYYLDENGDNLGPFSLDELKSFYKDGAVSELSFIWFEEIEGGGWKSANEVDGLMALLSAAGGADAAEDAGEAKSAAPGHRRKPSEATGAQNTREAAQSKARRSSIARAERRASAVIPAAPTDDMSRLKQLSQKKYVEQAQWFLNAYWSGEGPNFEAKEEERERVWNFTHSAINYDKKFGKDGNELDEFEAHMFLEKNVGALTVKKMRQVLSEIDVDFNKKVSLTEFLIYHYKIDYHFLVNAPQSDEESERRINEAKAALAAAQQALQESQEAAKEAAAAAAASAAAAANAQREAAAAAEEEKKAIEEEAKSAAAAEALAAAEAEAKATLETLEAEQKAYDDKCAELERIGSDDSIGIVKRNKANHELAQLKEKDPLPLNRAKINQGAAVRKVGKARKAADRAATAAAEARAQATEARAAAEAAAKAAAAAAEQAAAAAQAAEEAVKVADAAVEAAAVQLEEVKERCQSTATQGTLWWMDREWEEAKKYMSSAQIARLEARRNKK